VTDLRDQLADFEAAARRLLTTPRRLVLVHARPATCHPERPVNARGLCDSCYEMHWRAGTLDQFPTMRDQRRRVEFIADYRLLRSEGYTRSQIAERLRMSRNALDRAVQRAVRAGDLEPDRRTA
jgi:hypothetical protein